MTKRAHISLKTKLASALLQMLRVDDDGKFAPAIPYAEAKTLTADQIISRFAFDHCVHHALGGPDEPWNLTPRLKAEHAVKTAKIDIPAIAKTKRLARANDEAVRRLLAKDPGRKRELSSRWASRPFPKGRGFPKPAAVTAPRER